MNNLEIKAILFDLDGVIVDTAKYHYLAWKVLADELGIYFDEKINEKFKGVSRDDCFDILVANEQKKYSAEEKQTFATKKNELYVEMLKQVDENSILQGMSRFIRDAKSHNLKFAICSASKNTVPILKQLGIFEKFDVIVTGNDTKRSKPDPEVFQIGASRLKVPFENCLVVEDSQAGIDGANACGMQSVGIGSGENLKNSTKLVCCTAKMIWGELFESSVTNATAVVLK